MKFFLYGDHLNPTQLKRRAPEHQFLMRATLPEHTIKFCRWSSQWRCGLASVTPSPGEQVWGAVFEVTDEDLKLMDLFEEDVPPSAFRQVQVTVLTEAVAQPDFSISAFAAGIRTIRFLGLVERAILRLAA
jgi:gamma-glutamylcyclotransferase